LLAPTRIYVRSCLAATRGRRVKALAHITGGGLYENIPRVLPRRLAAVLDARSWPRPPVFGWLQRAGGIADAEMARTFNCGIGMMAVVAPEAADAVAAELDAAGETVFTIGRIVERRGDMAGGVVEGMAESWRG
jgi:phosphoribosylformylglycinamidine cyclo-ligase